MAADKIANLGSRHAIRVGVSRANEQTRDKERFRVEVALHARGVSREPRGTVAVLLERVENRSACRIYRRQIYYRVVGRPTDRNVIGEVNSARRPRACMVALGAGLRENQSL